MADDVLLRAFASFDRPVDPAPAFADRLYEELATDLGFRGGRSPRHVVIERGLARLGIRHLPVGRDALRLAYLAAILGLLLAMLLGALIVSGMLRGGPTPGELVTRSQAAYAIPPPFTMEMRDPQGQVWTLASDGAGTWRIDDAEGVSEPGSYTLFDGDRVGRYDAWLQTWGVMPVAEYGGIPYPLHSEFTWIRSVVLDGNELVGCDDATFVAADEVAGRRADHVRCPGADMDAWLDTETGLLLRMDAGPTMPGWEGPSSLEPRMVAVTFVPGAPDAARFSWDGPRGAYPADDPPASTVLVVGEPPPAWTATTTDGRAYEPGGDGRPTLLLVRPADPAEATVALTDALAAAAVAQPGVRVAILVVWRVDAELGLLERLDADLPDAVTLVDDRQGSVIEAWRPSGIPAVVALDADGHVALVHVGAVDPGAIPALVAALRVGGTMPSLEPAS